MNTATYRDIRQTQEWEQEFLEQASAGARLYRRTRNANFRPRTVLVYNAKGDLVPVIEMETGDEQLTISQRAVPSSQTNTAHPYHREREFTETCDYCREESV